MKRKVKMRQFLSGMMAVITIFSSIVSPVMTYAAEPEQQVKEYPLYEEVKDQLDADEVVKASDIEIDAGCSFDVVHDFIGIEIADKDKVKVEFHEAKNAAGEEFSVNHADTYKAIYYVEPVSEHPAYQVNRNIIVKEVPVIETEEIFTEKVTEAIASEVAEAGTSEEESASEQSEEMRTEEFPETENNTGSSVETDYVEPEMTTENSGEETEEEIIVVPEEIVQEEVVDEQVEEEFVTESTDETMREEGTEINIETEEIFSEDSTLMEETETDVETETEAIKEEPTRYQVIVPQNESFQCLFDREELLYEAGEEVRFSIVVQEGMQVAYLYITKYLDNRSDIIIDNPAEMTVELTENETVPDTVMEEIEMFYNTENDIYSFIMPDYDVELVIESSENAVMFMDEEETETETENEDPVPDKFKLVNSNTFCAVPNKYV